MKMFNYQYIFISSNVNAIFYCILWKKSKMVLKYWLKYLKKNSQFTYTSQKKINYNSLQIT